MDLTHDKWLEITEKVCSSKFLCQYYDNNPPCQRCKATCPYDLLLQHVRINKNIYAPSENIGRKCP